MGFVETGLPMEPSEKRRDVEAVYPAENLARKTASRDLCSVRFPFAILSILKGERLVILLLKVSTVEAILFDGNQRDSDHPLKQHGSDPSVGNAQLWASMCAVVPDKSACVDRCQNSWITEHSKVELGRTGESEVGFEKVL
jgi:hypothetical protein